MLVSGANENRTMWCVKSGVVVAKSRGARCQCQGISWRFFSYGRLLASLRHPLVVSLKRRWPITWVYTTRLEPFQCCPSTDEVSGCPTYWNFLPTEFRQSPNFNGIFIFLKTHNFRRFKNYNFIIYIPHIPANLFLFS